MNIKRTVLLVLGSVLVAACMSLIFAPEASVAQFQKVFTLAGKRAIVDDSLRVGKRVTLSTGSLIGNSFIRGTASFTTNGTSTTVVIARPTGDSITTGGYAFAVQTGANDSIAALQVSLSAVTATNSDTLTVTRAARDADQGASFNWFIIR